MKLYLSLFLPAWPIDRFLAKLDKKQLSAKLTPTQAAIPYALVTKIGGEECIADCSTAARNHGITFGMPQLLALARCPNLQLAPFDLRAELRALYRLAKWGLWISPIVGFDDSATQFWRLAGSRDFKILPDPTLWGFTADITGTEKVHGGWDALITRLSSRCFKAKLSHRIAIAPSIGAAWALARYGPQGSILIDRQEIKERIAPLPAASLRIPAAVTKDLDELGLTTVAALCSVPTKKITSRLGAQILLRLDQLLDRSPEVLRTVREPQPLLLTRNFEVPLNSTLLAEQALTLLALTLLKKLAETHRVSHCLQLTIVTRSLRNERTTYHHELNLIQPTYEPKHLQNVLTAFWERHPLPQAIIKLKLEAKALRASREVQLSTNGADPQITTNAEGELLNLLAVRLGSQRIQKVTFCNSHQPELSFSYQPLGTHAASAHTPALKSWGRPSQLLDVPEPIQALALLPDNPPAELSWRQNKYRITRSIGPERISSDWWCAEPDALPRARDYFKLQIDTGLWLWVFRRLPDHRWFLHGLWS